MPGMEGQTEGQRERETERVKMESARLIPTEGCEGDLCASALASGGLLTVT